MDKNHTKKHIAVDIDSTLAKYEEWQGPQDFGEPILGAKQFLEELHKDYFILIYSTRTNVNKQKGYTIKQLVKLVKDWLDKNDLVYDEIYSEEGKPLADAFIDDKSVPCRPEDSKYPEGVYDRTIKDLKELLRKDDDRKKRVTNKIKKESYTKIAKETK